MSRKRKHNQDENVIKHIASLTDKQRLDMCVAMALHMIETEDIFYREADEELSEGLFWESCGERVGDE